MVYDVAIIGAGVVGSLIARELSKLKLKICLLEKEPDVGMGASKANSGIIHAGYDAKPGTLKAKLNVTGNNLMDSYSQELGVKFKRTGSLVLAFNENDVSKLHELYENGLKNGVSDLRLLSGTEAKQLEPGISDAAILALYAPYAGIICPYELTIAAAENAVENGVELKRGCKVLGIIPAIPAGSQAKQAAESRPFILITSKGKIQSLYIINAAGVFADEISSMLNLRFFSITPRKGEYLILDKTQGGIVNKVIFGPPSKMGKGVLVSPTVDGNIILGPTAVDIKDKEDCSTTLEGLSEVIKSSLRLVPGINPKEVIATFAGIRAVPSSGDFIIQSPDTARGFINVAGIESPGLTASPAIAQYVSSMLKEMIGKVEENKDFNPVRRSLKRFKEMHDSERIDAIKKRPEYGNIVCRCETVSEAEIVDSINSPCGANDLDGVKRRTRAGMGRCQGGFCTPRVCEILSRELGIPMEIVTKMGGGSKIVIGETKEN